MAFRKCENNDARPSKTSGLSIDICRLQTLTLPPPPVPPTLLEDEVLTRDAAKVNALLHLDVSAISPGVAPRVPDYPVVHTTRSIGSESHDSHRVIVLVVGALRVTIHARLIIAEAINDLNRCLDGRGVEVDAIVTTYQILKTSLVPGIARHKPRIHEACAAAAVERASRVVSGSRLATHVRVSDIARHGPHGRDALRRALHPSAATAVAIKPTVFVGSVVATLDKNLGRGVGGLV